MKPKILLALSGLLLYAVTVMIPYSFYRPQTPPGFLEDTVIPEQTEDFTLYDQATGNTLTLTAEELLPNAVACEMDPASPAEALKAQAVACYSWFCYQKEHHREIVCDSEACLVWAPEEKFSEEDLAKVRACVEEVAGELLTVDGKTLEAEYCAISSGVTEEGVASPWDCFADGYLREDGTKGWGKNHGMSQAGAQAMAKLGFSYREILQHYYPLAELG